MSAGACAKSKKWLWGFGGVTGKGFLQPGRLTVEWIPPFLFSRVEQRSRKPEKRINLTHAQV